MDFAARNEGALENVAGWLKAIFSVRYTISLLHMPSEKLHPVYGPNVRRYNLHPLLPRLHNLLEMQRRIEDYRACRPMRRFTARLKTPDCLRRSFVYAGVAILVCCFPSIFPRGRRGAQMPARKLNVAQEIYK